jgi:replicative DNA helicase
MSKEILTHRLPPHDPDVEAALLGCLMIGHQDPVAEVMATHPQLDGYFYSLEHQIIFAAVRSLVELSQPTDVVSVVGVLRKRSELEEVGGLQYVSALPDKTPSGWNAPHYADRLKELFIKRRTIRACQIVSEKAFDGANTAELLDTVERELNGISSENAANEPDMKQLLEDVINDIEGAHRNQGQPQGITSGLADLDSVTRGLRPGQLFVIGGRPGDGKTSLGINIAEHVAIDCERPVGVFELEMSAKELTMRLISSRSEVPLDCLLSGRLSQEDFKRMVVANAAIAKAPLHIADESGITISQLKAKARRMHRRRNLQLLVVDYLQLIRPSRPNPSRNVEVSEISSSLKALAKELALPIITMSQLNRDSDTDQREPRLRDLRDSGSIEQDADIVGLLHRPDPQQRIVQLHIAKHRQGPQRKLKLIFFGETFRFRMAAS